ncbi:MAG: SMP-30/gluconolactonase/LRE family protein [Candidatus Zipacnadales bacterium]
MIPRTLASLLGLGSTLPGQTPPALPSDLEPYPVVADIAFAEGPIFDAAGNLYFVNYLRHGTIGVKTPDGTVRVLCETGGRVNGLKVDAEGYLIGADYESKRVLRISPDGAEVKVYADSCGGKPFRGLNDVCLDQQGYIYVSQCEGATKQTPVGAVYRISPDGSEVIMVAEGIAYANGLAVSPDQTRLFVAESATNSIIAFDLQPDGRGANRQVIHEFPDETVDGLMFDEFGRLWVARWTHGTVDVISQTGQLLGSLDAGGTQVTNLCWWQDQLYVTVAGRHSIHRFDVGCRAAPQIPQTSR